MRIRPITMAAFMSIGLPIAAIGQQPQEQPADEPQRQLGAHVHGAGKLSIAIEKRVVEIELEAPGSDIVGFEHAAATTDQKQAVARARATLAKPLTLIKLPEAAACKLISAKVKLVGGGSHDLNPDVYKVTLQIGDILLLCSDGGRVGLGQRRPGVHERAA